MKNVINLKEESEKYKDYLKDVDWHPSYKEIDKQTLKDLELLATTNINNVKKEQNVPTAYLVPDGFTSGGAAVLANSLWDDEDIIKTLLLNLFQYYARNNTYLSYDTGVIRVSEINAVQVYTITVFIKKGNIKTLK